MTRVRSSSSGGLTDENLEYEKSFDDSVVYGTNHTYTGTLVQKSITDTPTPGFYALKKCGKFLPLNGVDIVTRTDYRRASDIDVRYPGTTHMVGKYWYGNTPSITVPPPDPDRLQAVVNSAAARAASAKFDMLTFLGELRETHELLTEIAHLFNGRTASLAKEAAHFKRNPWKRFTELWLVARYGIRPMIYDARNAYLAAMHKEQGFIKGRDTSREDLNQTNVISNLDFYGRWKYQQTDTIRGTRLYRGCAYASADLFVGEKLGFDPLVTAWELTRYSFVVDWFIDIGSWLRSVRPRLLGEYLGIGSSIHDEYTFRQTLKQTSFTGAWYGSVSDVITEWSIKQYTRSPASVAFPPLMVNLNVPKMIDLAALFLAGKNNVMRILRR